MVNFTILRAGQANFIATVMYRFEYGDSSPGDFTPLSNDSLLLFGYGEWMKNISVAVNDDDIPETDESFYIVLHNTTGVLYWLHFNRNFVNVHYDDLHYNHLAASDDVLWWSGGREQEHKPEL